MSANNVTPLNLRYGEITQLRNWSSALVGASIKHFNEYWFPDGNTCKFYHWIPDSTDAPVWQMALILDKADELNLVDDALLLLQKQKAFVHINTKYHVIEFALLAMKQPLTVLKAIKDAEDAR